MAGGSVTFRPTLKYLQKPRIIIDVLENCIMCCVKTKTCRYTRKRFFVDFFFTNFFFVIAHRRNGWTRNGGNSIGANYN